ncbi:MAG: hypothetical protein KDD03_11890, partial [Gelidibacter sp.]|nr:hypothetical protein [Gelidibacter sp.]
KGPDFIKYLVIIIGITSIIWMYYNPLGARALYERAKYLLFGTPSVSLETGGKSEATILLGNNPKSHYKLIQSI